MSAKFPRGGGGGGGAGPFLARSLLKNISKYFRFVKELALYQNDNYMGSNENALIYNGCSTQDHRDRRGNPTQLCILKARI